MKNIFISFVFLCMIGFANAQTAKVDPPAESQKMQNIEALKIAFISRQIQLTPDEAEKFWPVYNQYSNEIHVEKVTINLLNISS